jgi:fido (protein-threonine AMPylation protein)
MDNNSKTWLEVLTTGQLFPEITNIRDYHEKWEENQIRVDGHIETLNKPYLETDDLLLIHKLSFEGITTFGGKTIKSMSQFDGITGAPPVKVLDEYKLLDLQMSKLWRSARTDEAKLKSIAFQKARIIAIHGLTDGNGRVSRKAMDYAVTKNFNFQNKNIIERSEYIKAMTCAIRGNNLAPLTKILSENYSIETSNQAVSISPYKCECSPIEKDLSGENGLELYKLNPLESINDNSGIKNYWLRTTDLTKILKESNGKKGQHYETFEEVFVEQVSSPLNLEDSISLIAKAHNHIKKKVFSQIDQEPFNKLLNERLQYVSEFSQEKESINASSKSNKISDFIINSKIRELEKTAPPSLSFGGQLDFKGHKNIFAKENEKEQDSIDI